VEKLNMLPKVLKMMKNKPIQVYISIFPVLVLGSSFPFSLQIARIARQ
jgi:hypothetical protein